MIKINLLAEKKAPKAKAAARPRSGRSLSGAQNLLLMGIVLVGVVASAGWWYMLNHRLVELSRKHVVADRELERLEEVRRKGEEYKLQKELLARKIELITQLKKQQAVPVHILDEVSRHLPDFLWLESMTANQNQIGLTGKATNYNSVSSFYQNLTDSGYFTNVTLGRTFEVPEGVAFSLSALFTSGASAEDDEEETS